jgi:hypothetical protein
MGFNDHNIFQKTIRSSKNLFIKLFANILLQERYHLAKVLSQPQLHIARNIINIQIPILEIPFQGNAS